MNDRPSRASRKAEDAAQHVVPTPPADVTSEGASDGASMSGAAEGTASGDAAPLTGASETLSASTAPAAILSGSTDAPPVPADAGVQSNSVHEGDGDAAGQAQGVAEDQMGARPEMAPVEPAQLEAQERETLIGTIGDWAVSGGSEIRRVSDLVAEHNDRDAFSADELEAFRAAFDDVRLEAMTAAELVKAQADMLRLQELDAGLGLIGIDAGDVLSISHDLRTIVTRDGRKVELA